MRAIEVKAERKYKRKATVGSILFTLFLVLIFFLLGFTEQDPLPIDQEEEQVVELDASDFEFDAPSSAGGSPSQADNPNPNPASGLDTPTDESSDYEVNKGQSNNDKPSNNKPAIDQGLAFGGGQGSGTSGTGTGTGTGIGNGSGDIGNGNGAGNGSRKMTSGPCVKESGLVPGKVFLILYVDASGKVIRASADMARTVGGNKSTYSAVEKGALDCMTFEPRPGMGTQKIVFKGGITVKAQ